MKTEKEKRPSRLSIPKSGIERLYLIDAEIRSGSYPNSKDLAKKCSEGRRDPYSVSTISRDIEFLKDRLYAPIKYDALNNGYYYTEKTFRLPATNTNTDGLIALGMAKSIMSLYQDTPLYEASVNLLENIIAPIAGRYEREWLENRIVFPKIASAKVEDNIWKTIVAGLKENRMITFDYLGMQDGDYSKRKVRPYQLLFDSGVWYLYGFSEERKAIRVFSLTRMKNAALTKECFQLPANYDYSALSGDSYFGVFIGQEKFKFVIDCYSEAINYAAERQWAADQKIIENDEGITLKFTSTQYDKVLRWVLSNGCNAVPRQPKQLVDDWKWHVKEMHRQVKK